LDDPRDADESGKDLPSELQDTLARYQKALGRLKDREAEAVDPLAAPREAQDGPLQGPERSAGRSDNSLTRYRQAVSRQQSAARRPSVTSAKAAGDPVVPRETLDQFRKSPRKQPEAPPKPHAAPRPRESSQGAPGAPLPWRARAIVFVMLLLANPPVQWLVYTHLGAAFALDDLVAGLSAILPAALILLGARPASGTGRVVTVIGSLAVALIGSAGFAFGLSLLQNELPEGTSLVLGLLLTLGLFTAVWGPLFLILAPVLARMKLSAQGRT
jgi:hypothetical protein